jgi:hypothetical protein
LRTGISADCSLCGLQRNFSCANGHVFRRQVNRISVLTACHAERRVGDRFSLADGTSGRRLEPIPFPEHEPAPSALGRNLVQSSPLGMKTFPKVFQVILDFFFRPMDGGGDLLCRVRPLLQESADLTPCGFRFPQLSDCGSDIHPHIIARLLSRRISCGERNLLPVRIPPKCKGNPPSIPSPRKPLFTPEKPVVRTGFAVRAAFLKSMNTSRDASWMA